MITNADTIHDALRGKNILYKHVCVLDKEFDKYKEFCLREDKFYYNHTFMPIPLRLYSRDANNPTGKVYTEICDMFIRLKGYKSVAIEHLAWENSYLEYHNTQPPHHNFLPIT